MLKVIEEFTSYFTNTHPGTARHGSQSDRGLQSVVVLVGLEGVGLGGVVLGGVEGGSAGRAIVWDLEHRKNKLCHLIWIFC